MSKTVEVPERITVSELADKLEVEVTELMTELLKNGIMVTLNDRIDFDTAQIIASELKSELELVKSSNDSQSNQTEERPKREMASAASRPPVIAVMGHVDHGKTTLLDAIRGASVVSDEAGGITQHISAYQVEHKKRKVTLLDTPGHEAFASLRQHGAHLTDLVILVVAADDGVKPQTVEAIKYAQTAGVKILVAINKVDKPGANVNRVLQELNDNGLAPESWGGDTVVVEVSALKQQGLDNLLDMALLITDVEELTADAEGPAQGIVIESHMEQGRGAVVSVLVEHGRLKKGDFISAGRAAGKVRTLEDYTGATIDEATASTPATITGLKEMPNFGAVFQVHGSEKQARAAAVSGATDAAGGNVALTDVELLDQIHRDRSEQVLPVVIKADVRGSVTSVIESINTLGQDNEVSVRVVGSGVGSVTESDVTMASATGAVIYGFTIDMPVNVKRLATRKGVDVRLFKIIYELIDDVRTELEKLLTPELVEENTGRLLIRGVFNTTKSEIICGGEVTKGKVAPGFIVKIYRGDDELGEALVTSVQKGQQEVKEVVEGEMCGLRLKTEEKIVLSEGDKLEFFTRETVKRKL